MVKLGFSKGLADWLGSNLKRISSSTEEMDWIFNVDGAYDMFASYRFSLFLWPLCFFGNPSELKWTFKFLSSHVVMIRTFVIDCHRAGCICVSYLDWGSTYEDSIIVDEEFLSTKILFLSCIFPWSGGQMQLWYWASRVAGMVKSQARKVTILFCSYLCRCCTT